MVPASGKSLLRTCSSAATAADRSMRSRTSRGSTKLTSHVRLSGVCSSASRLHCRIHRGGPDRRPALARAVAQSARKVVRARSRSRILLRSPVRARTEGKPGHGPPNNPVRSRSSCRRSGAGTVCPSTASQLLCGGRHPSASLGFRPRQELGGALFHGVHVVLNARPFHPSPHRIDGVTQGD